jgi:hypothetical protein
MTPTFASMCEEIPDVHARLLPLVDKIKATTPANHWQHVRICMHGLLLNLSPDERSQAMKYLQRVLRDSMN